MKIVGSIEGKNILLLQGPMGNFFQKFDQYLTLQGAKTYKICFNGGDQFFTRKNNRFEYREDRARWASYISEFIHRHQIEIIFLFGNCRFYHKKVIQIAQVLKIDVFVFEEGYIRPNYITLEKNGVNGDSSIPLDPQFYIHLPAQKSHISSPAKNNAKVMLYQATLYYLAAQLLKPLYPKYQHHRDPSGRKQVLYAIRNLIRKIKYRITERDLCSQFENDLKKKYYFVPLQTRDDFQLKTYSPYDSIEQFIQQVIESFAKNAPSETILVIKHHPMERGMPTHEHFIKELCNQYDVANRVLTIYDVHLPTCLINAIGTITINSTVGPSSLFHNTPTITLGTAMYDMPGLTCHGMLLDNFWTDYKIPDPILFSKFRNHVISETQLNGGFYGIFPDFSISTPPEPHVDSL